MRARTHARLHTHPQVKKLRSEARKRDETLPKSFPFSFQGHTITADDKAKLSKAGVVGGGTVRGCVPQRCALFVGYFILCASAFVVVFRVVTFRWDVPVHVRRARISHTQTCMFLATTITAPDMSRTLYGRSRAPRATTTTLAPLHTSRTSSSGASSRPRETLEGLIYSKSAKRRRLWPRLSRTWPLRVSRWPLSSSSHRSAASCAVTDGILCLSSSGGSSARISCQCRRLRCTFQCFL